MTVWQLDELASEGSAGTKQVTDFTLHMLTKINDRDLPRTALGANPLVECITPAEATHMLTQFNRG